MDSPIIAEAQGLAKGRVLASAKHFPGLGYASLTTDSTVARVTASARLLKADWAPFRPAINAGIPLVMVSTAVYPTLGSLRPAALEPKIFADLRELGFKGPIVTDAPQTPAVNQFMTTGNAAVEAVEAGADLVLPAGTTGDHANTDGASIPAYKPHLGAAPRRSKLPSSEQSERASTPAVDPGLIPVSGRELVRAWLFDAGLRRSDKTDDKQKRDTRAGTPQSQLGAPQSQQGVSPSRRRP